MDSRDMGKCLRTRAVLMEVDTHRDLIARHHRLLRRMDMLGVTHSRRLSMGQSTEDEGESSGQGRDGQTYGL